jgi:CheY-like chemotaxis protein
MGRARPAGPVLVVEDDRDVREATVELLRSMGFRALSAANGRDALGALEAGVRPCLILLDLMMQIMNGWEFLEEMMRDAELRRIPVIIVSAYLPTVSAAKLGVAAVLPKPFDPETLEALVERHCRTLH